MLSLIRIKEEGVYLKYPAQCFGCATHSSMVDIGTVIALLA
jgi:hypothetical protein